MESLFGIGPMEAALILIVATIVLGPQRIRQIARTLGVWTRKLQGITRGFTEQLNNELDEAEKADLKAAYDDIRSLRAQVSELRNEVIGVGRATTGLTQEVISETKQIGKAAQAEINGAVETASTESPQPSGLPKIVDIPDDPE